MKYHRLFDHLPMAVLEIDSKGKIRTVNDTTETIFSCSKNELKGRHWLQHFPEMSTIMPCDAIIESLTTKPHLFRVKKEGLFWVNCQIQRNPKHQSILLCLTKMTQPFEIAQPVTTYTPPTPVEKQEIIEEHFNDIPLPIVEGDYSLVYAYLENHRHLIKNDLNGYFTEHPAETLRVLSMRQIVKINHAALTFFKAKSKEEFEKNLPKLYLNAPPEYFLNIFQMLYNHEKYFEATTFVYDLTGVQYTVIFRVVSRTDDYSRIIITVEDISESKHKLDSLSQQLQLKTTELDNLQQTLNVESLRREALAKKLHDTELRFERLLKVYPVGIFHINQQGETIFLNSMGYEILGLTGLETTKEQYCSTIHADDYDMVVQDWDNAIYNQAHTELTYRLLKQEQVIWIRRIMAPEKDAHGNIIGYLGILLDITKAHEAEAQLAKNQSEIAHFSRLNSMGAVASSIAHELNQPLSAIINYASGLKRRLKILSAPPIAQNIMDAVDHVITQAERAGNIIHHLKDFLRKGTLNKKQTDINVAIKDVLVFVNRRMIQNKIAIRLMLDTQLPQIIADKIHIEQVVLNIINNAIDAINEASPLRRVVTIRTKPVESDKICISIADTGIGIGSDFLDLLFKPFATTKNEGMGIGLSLCYNIIEKHGGKIDIVTRHNKGTIFHILLPLNGGAATEHAPKNND